MDEWMGEKGEGEGWEGGWESRVEGRVERGMKGRVDGECGWRRKEYREKTEDGNLEQE